jgi:superfamily I DNA/RNA helicase
MIEFNPDGSLKLPNKENLDYINVLRALDEIPFNVGRKLLIEFLQGKLNHESISKNKLDRLMSFGTLGYEDHEIEEMIDKLIKHNMIKITNIKGNLYWKVLEITEKGKKEINTPSLNDKKMSYGIAGEITEITETDKKLFSALGDELSHYNDLQKKAITSNQKQILCIAGAGSGKTTVLTKRIEFLIKYKSVNPKKILAITFTKKARHEMQKRLTTNPDIKIETFNSFCEKLLLRYNDIIYPGEMSVVTYKDKRIMINKALFKLKLDITRAINIYFTQAQKRSKSDEQLANILLNDCFFVLDYFKFKDKDIEDVTFDDLDFQKKKGAELVQNICKYIKEYMQKKHLRDFADQLIDTIKLFKSHPELIPEYDHILIDEYQDVNSSQINLIDLLNPKNIFCVGDPRQSIYGWRGSDIRYILDFKSKYLDSEVIVLTQNYRSSKHIVDLINKSIRNMALPDLDCDIDHKKDIHLLKFDSEDGEFEFVMQNILSDSTPRNEIFILARTNRQLNELSLRMQNKGIKHIVRSEERLSSTLTLPTKDEVVLATIHAIKGLEADKVLVIGCTLTNFPCKGSEHPAMEMINVEEYDKEEEERRLLYVAMSRAKKTLILTYTGTKHTYFINNSMLSLLNHKEINFGFSTNSKINNTKEVGKNSPEKRLRDWRRKLASETGLPAYMIMNDKTLIEIIQNMPSSTDELQQIYGLGPNKIKKYGEEIIDMING